MTIKLLTVFVDFVKRGVMFSPLSMSDTALIIILLLDVGSKSSQFRRPTERKTPTNSVPADLWADLA